MSTLCDLLLLPFLLWLAAWRLLGDRNGWLAFLNAWAWWLLSAALPAGMAALWRRSRLASLLWGVGVAAFWLREYGWTLPALKNRTRIRRIEQIQTDTNPENPENPCPNSSFSLSLLTFNLLNNQRNLTPLLALVARETPDVLLFQECIPSHAAQLERGLAACYPHRLWLPAPEYGMGFGIASRLPFALTGFWQYPGFEPFATRVTIALPHPTISSSLLDLYCVQFISPTNEVRRVGPTALLRLRERQIDWVLAEIDRRQRPALVVGDWNTTEGSDAYRRVTAQLVDGWREAGNGPGWSWPRRLNPLVNSAALPVLRLDYALHTSRRFAPALAVAEMRVIQDALGSDHCPLLARVEMEEVRLF